MDPARPARSSSWSIAVLRAAIWVRGSLLRFNGPRRPLTYLQANQINAQAPTLGQITGSLPVTVILNPGEKNELRSDPAQLTSFRTWAPAFFTFNGKSIAAQIAGTTTIVADPAVVAGG